VTAGEIRIALPGGDRVIHPYNWGELCPKCGRMEKASRVYVPAQDAEGTEYVAEHLYIECKCGYWWREHTRDSGAPR
jgi:hypothetical protein